MGLILNPGVTAVEKIASKIVNKRYGQQQEDYEPSQNCNKLQLIWSKNHTIQVGVLMSIIVQTNKNMAL